MTTATVNNSQDVPLAQVSTFGLSEITTLLTLLGSVLTVAFGKDFGIGAHVQAIAAQAVIILPIGLGLFRSIKHHGIAKANAIVLAQQVFSQYTQAKHAAPLAAVPQSAPASPLSGQPAASDL